MRILYIDVYPDKKVINYLKKIDKKLDILIIKSLLKYFKINFNKNKKYRYFLILLAAKAPFYIFSQLLKSILEKNNYRTNIRNCILDQIERENGELSTKYTSKKYIRKNIIKYLYKSIKLYSLIYFIKIYINHENINAAVLPQLDGYPYGGVSAYFISRDLYLGSWINAPGTWDGRPPLLFTIRKGYHNIHCPMKNDLYKLQKLSDKELDKKIYEIKSNYLNERIDWINLPNNEYSIKNQEVDHYKSLIDPTKKTAFVLLHHFTDQSRPRLTNTWFENYLDWLIETISFCKLNTNINWIFKNHPNSVLYPLKEYQNKFIYNLIKDNKFIFIDSTKIKFLQKEVSQIASIIVTCGGTCKLEYPALFGLPVISCIGRDSQYLYEGLSLVAKSQNEYKELIMQAQNLSITNEEIRYCKESLVYYHNKNFSQSSNNERLVFSKYYDPENRLVLRNF